MKGNVGEYSTTIGSDNFFLPYNVKITPFNMFGDGRPGYNDSVYSAEGSKSANNILVSCPYTVNSPYLIVEMYFKLLISQSEFSGLRKFTLRNQWFETTGVQM